MNKNSKTIETTAKQCGEMETRDHSKNRASLKSLTSRGNIIRQKILFCFILCVSISVWGQEKKSIEEISAIKDAYYHQKTMKFSEYNKTMKQQKKLYTASANKGDAVEQYNAGIFMDVYYGTFATSIMPSYMSKYSVTKQALSWYIKSAKQNYAPAQYRLGIYYENKYALKSVKTNFPEALKWYQKSAEQGYAEAQNSIGDCYFNGKGVDKNYDEAIKWYIKAAEQNNISALYNMGCCYINGKGVEKNVAEAAKWFRSAAEYGHRDAQLNMANCYEKGLGVEQNYQEAIYWYQQCIRQGYTDMQKKVDACYSELLKYYRKNAEQNNDAAAQYNLGNCYFYGEGIEQNYSEAVSWYTKSAEQGNRNAQYALANCYHYGDGVSKNYSEAIKWYTKVAEQDDAQNNIGDCYAQGYGDFAEAVKWFSKSAENNNACAQYNLAICYYNGQGVNKDYSEALKWFDRSYENGYAPSLYYLGDCYYKINNYEKAAEVFTKLLDMEYDDIVMKNMSTIYILPKYVIEKYNQGLKKKYEHAKDTQAHRDLATKNPEAMFILGVMYHFGYGVSQNYAEAKKCYETAANKNYAQAQYSLGNMYFNGEGVEQDYKKAADCYQKAAARGYGNALYTLGNMHYLNKTYKLNKNDKKGDSDAKTLWEKAAKQAKIHEAAFVLANSEYKPLKKLNGFTQAKELGNIPAKYKVAELEADRRANPGKYKSGLDKFADALNVASAIVGVATNVVTSYQAIKTGVSGGSVSSYSSASRSGSNSTTSTARNNSNTSSAKNNTNEVMMKNRDANTYSDLESQVIRMHTLGGDQSQYKNCQEQMKKIRQKWESRGYKMYKSEWENK
jgi:TPR repeat protein